MTKTINDFIAFLDQVIPSEVDIIRDRFKISFEPDSSSYDEVVTAVNEYLKYGKVVEPGELEFLIYARVDHLSEGTGNTIHDFYYAVFTNEDGNIVVKPDRDIFYVEKAQSRSAFGVFLPSMVDLELIWKSVEKVRDNQSEQIFRIHN